MTRIISLLGLLLLFSQNVRSQDAFMGGVNLCYVRNHNLLINQNPIIAYHFGFSFKMYPFKKKPDLSLQSELMFNQKGYMQKLEKDYFFHFNYFSWTILANYPVNKELSVNTGLEISGLLSTNIIDGLTTYNHSDIGLVLGISCFETHRINFYSRVVYGLLPMLDYYKIDKLGNFTGKIHDLKNMTLSAGIKINLTNEKIRLFK